MKNFSETNIPTMATQEFYAAALEVEAEDVQSVLKSAMLAIVKFLKIKRDKNKAIAFVVENKQKQFVIASILSYTKSEDDEETKGSWNLSFTFDQEDIKDIETKYMNNDSEYDTFFSSELSYFGWSISAGVSHQDFGSIPFFVLKKYLEYNASEDAILEVNLFDLAKITVSVEEGKKVYTFEPSEVLRQFLKDDAN